MASKRLTLKLKKILLAYWAELVLLAVVFLRLPSLFEPLTYGDEGIYLTLGQAVRKGLVLYRDIHDNKPPLLYWLAAATGSFEIFRLLLFFWSLATIFLFYHLSRRLFANNKLAVITTTVIFALLTSSHTFEGNIANAENFMMLPTIGGVLLIMRGLDLRDLNGSLTFFSAGILFSLATLFKVPATFDFVAIAIFFFLVSQKKNYQLPITNYFLLLIGFLLPILITIVYFAPQNALNQYLTAAFFQNLPYLSSWAAGQTQVGGLPLLLLGRGMAVLLLVLALFFLREKISSPAQLILVWFAFSWLAALLSSRPYPHYLIQILPAFSLSFGLLWETKRQYLLIPFLLLIVLVATFWAFDFWHYPNLPYYLNFYQYALGVKPREKYAAYFGTQTKTIYQLANYLKTHTLPQEKVFIWGNDPYLYALADRLPVGRYTVAYHIHDFNGYGKTLEALNRTPPRYLIVTGTESRPFPQLTAFIQAHYLLEAEINGAQVFHRLPQTR